MAKRMALLLILCLVVLMLPATIMAQSEKSVVDLLAEDGRFTTLLAAIERTESQQAFAEGKWTLFAPTDAAFARLGLNAENLDAVLTLQETADLLLYQAMTKEITSDDAVLMLGDVTMANGWLAGLKWYDGALWVNDDARVIESDKMASNGVIHVVNAVITPPWPRRADEPPVGFMGAVEEAERLQAEQKASMESDGAEDAGGEGEGASSTADSAETETAAALDTQESFMIPAGSILDVMARDGRFTTYLEAVGDLGLAQPYSEGTWTIFAPTDEAFAAAGVDAGNISETYSVGELADLLLYHALDKEVKLDKAKTMLGDVTMRNGQLAGLKWFDDSLWVNDHARVIDADISASNGIVHALDAIIERPWPLLQSAAEVAAEPEGLPSGVIP